MPRPKKHPDYNPEKIMNELLETVSELYNSHLSIRKIGDELDLDWQKVWKMLCTASYRVMVVYDSEIADVVMDYYKRGKVQQRLCHSPVCPSLLLCHIYHTQRCHIIP